MKRSASTATQLKPKPLAPTEWFCHCCMARNHHTQHECRVCGRPDTYALAPHLPLHDIGRVVLRPSQIGTLLPEHHIHDYNEMKWTALHSCAAIGNISLVTELLDRGSEVEAATEEGFTPLHLAAHSGSIEVVSILVVRKVNINAQTFFEKNTPLHIAVQEGWRAVSQYLIDMGADVNIVNAVGRAPMHIAAATGRVDIGRYLLKNKANFTLLDYQGWTPQQVAEYHNHFEFQELMMRAALKDSQHSITEIVKGEWDTVLWNQVVRSRREREDALVKDQQAYGIAHSVIPRLQNDISPSWSTNDKQQLPSEMNVTNVSITRPQNSSPPHDSPKGHSYSEGNSLHSSRSSRTRVPRLDKSYDTPLVAPPPVLSPLSTGSVTSIHTSNSQGGTVLSSLSGTGYSIVTSKHAAAAHRSMCKS
mmetsp:Transcript_1870/g.2973  ORF Transcript_1870/g.2973 Transcript_1870/m.2973 type:complete len:419 (+) Transcript_1870:111-1367(+)